MSRNDVEAVLKALDGWSRGDMEAWLGQAHPDAEFWTSGVYPGLDPVYRGREELICFWHAFREPWESIRIHMDEMREVGDLVVALCTFEGRARDGMTVRREAASTWQFDDGLYRRARWYGSWAEALEDAEHPE